ncbi:hypothetical protein FJ959_08760 [Mesorhizobium sp. B2-2-4]|uniref:hypothetical protein n=1 Tax=unclassified Mesorhizobium TaxID=325217 RepID=UPI00112978C9|nr:MULTISPECIES: hypothetical protein [unclassified Mesorhizobium]TPM58955.1 hypothetical protein FJ959_08760 [Mesorhizobium sp. B2-2-4]TPM67440.1 hypothetical protein FJ965_09900 [Mesorhizobium sp. B2-2-1]
MSEIPKDVGAAAVRALAAPEYEYFERVSQAILAERKRCADIARSRFTIETVIKTAKGEPYLTGKAAIYAAERIADAIEANP